MDIYTALVFTVGSIVGGIIITQLLQFNYYKKKNFNHNLWQRKQQDTIKLNSLKRELGLGKKSTANKTGLNADDIKGLISQFVGGGNEEEPEENWIQDTIFKIAENNPEMVQGLLERFAGGGGSGGEETAQNIR